jgi:hypothetical protein
LTEKKKKKKKKGGEKRKRGRWKRAAVAAKASLASLPR